MTSNCSSCHLLKSPLSFISPTHQTISPLQVFSWDTSTDASIYSGKHVTITFSTFLTKTSFLFSLYHSKNRKFDLHFPSFFRVPVTHAILWSDNNGPTQLYTSCTSIPSQGIITNLTVSILFFLLYFSLVLQVSFLMALSSVVRSLVRFWSLDVPFSNRDFIYLLFPVASRYCFGGFTPLWYSSANFWALLFSSRCSSP